VQEIESQWEVEKEFVPTQSPEAVEKGIEGWHEAVRRVLQ